MKFVLESSFLTWNSIPVKTTADTKDVVFVYSGEGQAKVDIDGNAHRFHLVCTGGEKFDAGENYLDYLKGNYYDCYAHVNLRDADGDLIIINSGTIDNQDFIMRVAGGTGKWEGIKGKFDAKLTFVEVRKTEGNNPQNHYWCVYAFEGTGDVELTKA
ncbi:hypothetical protein [Vibrio maritimus]|uniref:hypothetical protein n=1 Tax=Vibrio maritimus TaxID=990268 RepID=UPI001F178124|nr:hypothetical protein [Vibrio maritimus]